MKRPWHSLTADDALSALDSRRDGLTSEEATTRLARHGPNHLVGKKKTPPLVVLLRQFLSPLIYILLAAVAVSIIVGDLLDAWVILAVLVLNAVVGFVQETRAEKAMEALIQMAAPKARVRRDGRVQLLAATEIVPGDIVTIEAGDKVPGDARIVSVSNLKVNESALTGESMPIDKSTAVVDAAATATGVTAIADRLDLVYMGTIVTYGRATAVITETGMRTEIGRIATAIQAVEETVTPLQRSIAKISNYVIVLFLAVCGLLAIVGLIRGLPWLEVFLLAVAAAVSAIPEGLPAVVTVVLAVGMRFMAQRNAIIRKLVAVETLGSATVICSDKTGTLTLNEMTVRRLYIGGRLIKVAGDGYDPSGNFSQDDQILDPAVDPELLTMLRAGALCNDAQLTGDATDGTAVPGIIGDPTEGALVAAAAKAGLAKNDMESESPRLDEIPFRSERLYMATLHEHEFSPKRKNSHGRARIIYLKGAVERLLPLSQYLLRDGKVAPLRKADASAIADANTAMATDAMRVIAVAYLEVPETLDKLTEQTLKHGLVFVGLAGMADPPRDEAREAIGLCHGAGIKVIMITGDNRVTAESIARQLDLPTGRAVTGPELATMSDKELAGAVEDVSVFARIEPLHKLRIVNALKTHGHVVAMTGDGVNDALALRAADIGVAMGITGTDVAKEASDVVLTDDNFASVVSAVEEGRAIFNRLRGVVFFLLSTNLGELIALILSVLVVGKAPLLAVQIIWVNLVTDTVPAIPLGLEPRAGDEIKHPPRDPRVGLIYPGLIFRILFLAVQMGVGLFLVFTWAESRMPIEEARTLAFCSMSAFELFRAFNARSDERTVFSLGVFRNRWLVYATFITIALQLMVVYVPFLRTAFGTVPIGLDRWGIALLAGGSMFAIEEIRKKLFSRLFSLGKWRPARTTR